MGSELRAEPALPAGEAALATVLETVPVPAVIGRASDGVILFANERFRSVFGRGEGAPGLTSPDLFSTPEDCQALNAALTQHGRLADYRVSLRTKDRPLRASVHAEVIAYHGQRAVFLSLHSTGQKDTQPALPTIRGSEELFEAIAEKVPIPLCIAREDDLSLLYRNQKFRETFFAPGGGEGGAAMPAAAAECLRPTGGGSPEGQRGGAALYWDPEERPAVLDRLKRDGRLRNCEVRLKRADGTMLWAAVSAERLRYKGEAALVAAVQDITDTKAAEEELARQVRRHTAELEERNRRLETIAEATPVPMAISCGGLIRWANRHFADACGVSAEQLVGRGIADFYCDSEARRRMVAALAERKYLANYELQFKRADGTPFWVAAYFRDIVYEGCPGVFGALCDITERKQGEEARQARQVAEAANRAKTAMLRAISHDLNIPLNNMVLAGELLRRRAEKEGRKEYLDKLGTVLAQAREQETLIKEIMDFCRREENESPILEREWFPLAGLLAEVEEAMRPSAEQHGNALEVRADGEVGSMFSDRRRVKSVLRNLVSNACKFTSRGRVSLRASREQAGGEEWLRFVVTDTGIGMTPDQRERLFKPFPQRDRAFQEKYGGFGVGLVVSADYCRLLGGNVAVTRSEPGKGSTFEVRLPAGGPGEAPAVPAATAGADRQGGGNTVLVIDDDFLFCDLIRQLLTEEGFAVRVATTGEEGLRLARELRPPAIALDAVMLEIDGWEVLHQLKADPATADIPVVMVTKLDERRRGFALGASDYLSKPVAFERLTAVLRRYVGEPPAGRVLVVDGNLQTRQALAAELAARGWAVVEADNGRSALERLAAPLPRLVLLDLHTPEMDGLEFVHELRQREGGRAVPVVVLTEKELAPEERARLLDSVERILRRGAYSPDELVRELRAVMSQPVGRHNPG